MTRIKNNAPWHRVGSIHSPWGMQGWVNIFTSSPQEFSQFPQVFFGKDKKTLTLQQVLFHPKNLRVQFHECCSRSQAEDLTKEVLWAQDHHFPALKNDEVYVKDLLHCIIRNTCDPVHTGTIAGVENFGSQDLLRILRHGTCKPEEYYAPVSSVTSWNLQDLVLHWPI